jgi:hypothetical protein
MTGEDLYCFRRQTRLDPTRDREVAQAVPVDALRFAIPPQWKELSFDKIVMANVMTFAVSEYQIIWPGETAISMPSIATPAGLI